jgi:hypothetical protein
VASSRIRLRIAQGGQPNEAIALSAIEAFLIQANILYVVSEEKVSVPAGSINVFPRRVLVRDCSLTHVGMRLVR